MSEYFNGYSIWDPRGSKNTDKVTEANPNDLPAEALKYQENKAKEILSCCVPRNAMNNTKKVGLVVGKVQSGKTTSFTYLTSLAADNGYKIIIHLLGTATNLKNDNAKSVKKILCTDDNDNYWRAVDVLTNTKINPSPETLEQILYEDTDPNLDFLPEQKETVVYFYLLKNHSAIKKMTDYMKNYHNNLSPNRGPLPVMIVDDEVDTYSPDASKPDEDPTTTHTVLSELYDSCPIVSYVGYTATSQAIAYAEESNFLNPDFVCTLEPGENYDGNLELFGEELERIKGANNCDTPNIKEINLPDFMQGTNNDDDDDVRSESLHEAIRYYLVSSIIYFDRQLERKHTTMMVHGDRKVDVHRIDAEIVKNYLFVLENLLEEDNENGNLTNAMDLFKYIYDELFDQKVDRIRFDQLVKRIRAVIKAQQIKIEIVNADKTIGNVTIPEIDWEDSNFWIVIGGHGLSRGYVVSGLITTWMPREAKKITADTIEQLGRFFGYHKKYKDLIRVFLRRKSIEAFKAYHIFEKSVWNALLTCISDGTRIFDTTLELEMPIELDYPTSSTKMKRPDSINKFLWASSAHSPFITTSNFDVNKNNEFHKVIKNYIYDLKTNGSLGAISIDAYKSLFNNYNGDDYLFDCYKVAENIDINTVVNNFVNPLEEYVSNNDENLIKMFSDMRNDNTAKCDVILISHPGQNGGPSKRGIDIDPRSNEFKMKYIQQGPSVRTTFIGDKEVAINELNYQIQIICYDQVHMDGDIINNISDFRVISIMKPNREEVSVIKLL